MRVPRSLLGLLAVTVLAPGAAAAPAPQVVDIAGDANLVNGQGYANVPGRSTAPASLGFADVKSVLWETTYTTRRVGRRTVRVADGLRVTTELAAAPEPPEGTILVYRMLATPPCNTGGFFGVVYYSEESNDPGIPRSAVRDNCSGTTRLSEIAAPAIQGSKMIWTVKLRQLPQGVRAGQVLTGMRFEVRAIQQYPACLPEGTPAVGACGMAYGLIDEGSGTGSYRIGS